MSLVEEDLSTFGLREGFFFLNGFVRSFGEVVPLLLFFAVFRHLPEDIGGVVALCEAIRWVMVKDCNYSICELNLFANTWI